MYEEYKNIFGATNFPKPRLNSDSFKHQLISNSNLNVVFISYEKLWIIFECLSMED